MSDRAYTASTPNHLGSNIPSGQMRNNSEKQELPDVARAPKAAKHQESDDDEDEDMDALIDDLESQDGQAIEEEEEEAGAGETPPISEEFLNTSTRTGLTESEVQQRRKKFGLNQMKEEKENLILKFLGYFVGPIQFVMEVCTGSFERIAPYPPSRRSIAAQSPPLPLLRQRCQEKKSNSSRGATLSMTIPH